MLRSRHAVVAQCNTARAYVDAIRDSAASLVPECTPATTLACRALSALSRSLDLQRSAIENAYEESVAECDHEFWSLLRVSMPAFSSKYIHDSENEANYPLRWFDDDIPCRDRVCLKLVPRPPKGAPPPLLASEHVYHGLLLHKLDEHEEAITAIAFSPDGTRVVTGSRDTRSYVWDAATGALLATLGGDGAEVNSVAFSPDGRRVVVASREVRVWNAAVHTR